ncbi:hypothetical protein E2C01_033342 [Portunus trituberculatus]|uniref:Uncharacterized protein n=1 Tax=Portunus trituberculatus TaxID=210409 RepID=A0A5B7EZW2_PORTR|nr:hypothetical protein [Portunus trituberculatus]
MSLGRQATRSPNGWDLEDSGRLRVLLRRRPRPPGHLTRGSAINLQIHAIYEALFLWRRLINSLLLNLLHPHGSPAAARPQPSGSDGDPSAVPPKATCTPPTKPILNGNINLPLRLTSSLHHANRCAALRFTSPSHIKPHQHKQPAKPRHATARHFNNARRDVSSNSVILAACRKRLTLHGSCVVYRVIAFHVVQDIRESLCGGEHGAPWQTLARRVCISARLQAANACSLAYRCGFFLCGTKSTIPSIRQFNSKLAGLNPS